MNDNWLMYSLDLQLAHYEYRYETVLEVKKRVSCVRTFFYFSLKSGRHS